ncbi:MAG: ParA family protein [Myxococcales bacterium]|nr:ParA family protein [Myxococcales bacterium]MCB9642358.1 ParA family protein [Myxococcales bacterium]
MALKETFGNLKRMLQGPRVQSSNHKAIVVAVTAQKGGVGKTTTAVHLAAGLAQFHKRKVLLVDMDAQGHVGMSLSSLLTTQPNESLGNILLQKHRDIQELATETSLENLWVIPSDKSLNDAEAQLASRIGKEFSLKQKIDIARTHYDVILIDCPPNIGTLTLNALTAADYVLVPCDMSILSLDGVTSLLETTQTVREVLNPDLKWLGVVRTRLDRRNVKLNRTIVDALREQYGEQLFNTEIGSASAIVRAQLAGKTVYAFDPKSRATRSYRVLTDEFAQRLGLLASKS